MSHMVTGVAFCLSKNGFNVISFSTMSVVVFIAEEMCLADVNVATY